MDARADSILRQYFTARSERIDRWFNIITPARATLATLKKELAIWNAKDWSRILPT